MTNECGKCDGKGRIEGLSHVANGVCFWCKGTGKLAASKFVAQVDEAAVALGESRKAWLAKFDGLAVDKVVAMFRAKLTFDQCYRIHASADVECVAWKAARQIMLENVIA